MKRSYTYVNFSRACVFDLKAHQKFQTYTESITVKFRSSRNNYILIWPKITLEVVRSTIAIA